ncbi:MAG: Pseudouridine synthase, RluA family [Parcubacteria group bacterium GW2011_GWB1_35_5]|nr:MAG: Pseudouridine synthase, RluA family [Parcubacteria group bacterium GW2011_GWB1_35_5]
MKIKIIYEDEYILALDKPSGLLVHTDGRSKEKTLVDWINENYPKLKEVGEEQTLQNGEKIQRPGIVHRLDRDTSGIIIVAKTKETYQFLKEQFQDRKVQKIYNAVVWGNFSPDKIEGVIEKPIGRSASDFRKWSAEYGAKGELREAVTEYKVLVQNKDFSFLEVRPKTGRTHQIRVHLKSISHPVVCDKLYGSKKSNELQEMSYDKKENLGFDRLALHALSIKLELPKHTSDL